MESRWKASLITFILFITRSGFSQELDDFLSHCPSDLVVSNGIVDIKTSVARGAELLQGRQANGSEACTEECCKDGLCDLALYRLEGLSDHGNNCYFIRCGEPANCKIVRHDKFVFAFVSEGKTGGGDTSGRESDATRVKPVEDTKSTVPPTIHDDQTSLVTEHQPGPTENLATQSTPSTDTPTSVTEKVGEPDSTDTFPPAVQTSDAQNQQLSTVTMEEVDSCEKSGCNGTGVIVFGVLGGIAMLLLSLIALAVGKRLYDFYKRKQFGNVDYLINGMYA